MLSGSCQHSQTDTASSETDSFKWTYAMFMSVQAKVCNKSNAAAVQYNTQAYTKLIWNKISNALKKHVGTFDCERKHRQAKCVC